jgi:hypothetical protein
MNALRATFVLDAQMCHAVRDCANSSHLSVDKEMPDIAMHEPHAAIRAKSREARGRMMSAVRPR